MGEVRHFGMSKEGRVACQFMLGVVQTAEGIPLYHQVFDGHTAEVTTLNNTQPVSGISSINHDQAAIFSALTIKKLTSHEPLTLL